MNRKIIILVFVGLSQWTFSQTCMHFDLSNQFNIRTEFKRIKDDSCIVIIAIKDKDSNITKESIKYSSSYLFDKVFKDCKSARSYQTHVNDTFKVVDNDFGDLIVADFNFDGLDDIAMIKDSGGNGGPIYNFYTQGKNRRFYFDKFLSNKMEFFPMKINIDDKTLVTYVHAGVCGLSEMIYLYNSQTNSWMRKSHKIIDICKK
jgi:hypothetical protein